MPKNQFPYPGKFILLAEDNIDNQELMKDMMEYLGCFLDIAANGEEALEMWKKNQTKYDLIIMDIQMPKMDGYQATKEIRNIENHISHIPILALTASTLTTDLDQCIKSGMDDYLIKPINIDMLEKKLCKIFSKQ